MLTSFADSYDTHTAQRDMADKPATKVCARCKTELENNQTNYPHGSSWCIACCPPDSDSD